MIRARPGLPTFQVDYRSKTDASYKDVIDHGDL